MTQTPAARHLSEQQAGSLTTGSHILLPDGERTAEIHQVELEPDDFGSPALVLASLAGGGIAREPDRDDGQRRVGVRALGAVGCFVREEAETIG